MAADPQKLDVCLKAVDALTKRMDAISVRADAGKQAGRFRVEGSQELDLGRAGSGEVVFDVTISYSIDISTQIGQIKPNRTGGRWAWTDPDGEDVPFDKQPNDRIKVAVERYLAGRQGQEWVLEQVLERL